MTQTTQSPSVQPQIFDAVTTGIDRPMLIEASAGTGKTYSLMHLILRLLVEKELPLNSILVVTFTKMATYELASRLRQILTELTESLKSLDGNIAAYKGDPVIKQQLELWNKKGWTPDVVLERLRNALDSIDDAAIFTIHGFCQRILQDFVFSSKGNYGFSHGDDTDAKHEAVQSFLRSKLPEIFPDKPELQYFVTKNMDWEKVLDKVAGLSRVAPVKDQAKLVLKEDMQEAYGLEEADREPILRFFNTFIGADDEKKPDEEIQSAAGEYRKNKIKERIFTYDDLLIETEERVAKEPQFAVEVRKQFKAALIDEFQDTDPIQYSIFSRLFLNDEVERPVIFVGDPKQSIYAFRNADLDTYLEAKRKINNSYELAKNFRSTPGIIVAVNEIFKAKKDTTGASKPAFLNDRLSYNGVAFNDSKLPLFFKKDNGEFEPVPSFALWSNISGPESQSVNAGPLRETAAILLAEDISELLSGRYYYNGSPLKAADIAVLVLRRKDAAELIHELTKRNIRYMMATDDDVLKSEEAEDIKRLLRAIIDPKDTKAVSAAQATKLFGSTLKVILEDEDATSAARLSLEEAARRFEKDGILAAFSALFSSSETEKRMLESGGERALTNYQHILELLYEQRREIPTLQGLLRWLEQDRHDGEPDEFKTRRETDQDVVRIETVHASKGLQYPVVYYLDRSRDPQKTDLYKDAGEVLEQKGQWIFTLEEAVPPSAVVHKDTEESIRKLYVALTRATARLVVPFFCKHTQKGIHASVGGKLSLARALTGDENASVSAEAALKEFQQALPTFGKDKMEERGFCGPAQTAGTAATAAIQDIRKSLKETLDERAAEGDTFPFPLDQNAVRFYSPFDIRLDFNVDKILTSSPHALVPPLTSELSSTDASAQSLDWRKSSFSGLVRNIEEEDREVITDDETEEPDEIEEAEIISPTEGEEADFLEVIRGSQSAAEFGTDIHALMENIFGPDVSSWQMKVSRFIQKRLKNQLQPATPAAEEDENAERALIEQAQEFFDGVLSSPIQANGETTFCLKELLTEGSEKYPELEFLLSVKEPEPGANGDYKPLTADRLVKTLAAFDPYYKNLRLTSEELKGYLTGSIDLAFGADGRYWILDWKTNKADYRSNRPSLYTEEAVQKLMADNHYRLQLTLYLVALKRLLEQRLGVNDAYDQIGGGVYYFLRGSDGKGRGITVHRPEKKLIETLDHFLKYGYSESYLAEQSQGKEDHDR